MMKPLHSESCWWIRWQCRCQTVSKVHHTQSRQT